MIPQKARIKRARRECMAYRSKARILESLLTIAFIISTILSVSYAYASDTASEALLDMGFFVNAKMKALAISNDPEHEGEVLDIKAIRMTDSLPKDFIPSDANTVSSFHSTHPIYIFFDNDNTAGVMYYYTNADKITMHSNSAYMFSDLAALTDISGISNWDTSKVTNMSGLFYGATSLPDALSLRDWDTSNTTDMSYMFSKATSLLFVDVSNWNTSNVTDMTCMFQVGESFIHNGKLVEINGLSGLDVSNVRDMTCMFYGASQMTFYDVSRWDVSKVESMNHMFCDNNSLNSLDLSQWDVSSVKTIHCMFDDCHALKTIGDVSHWNTINLIDAGGWLNGANSFVGDNTGTLDLSGWNTSNLRAAGEMFLRTQLRKIDLTGWTFDSITNDKWEGTGYGIYYETGNIPKDLKGFGQMFKDTPYLTTVYVSQSGLDSFNAAVEREVNTLDMWTNSKTDGFTVK